MSRLEKGYEFDSDGAPHLRPDYDYERLLELASEPDEFGYQVVTVEISEDETAWAPGSTKWAVRGPAKIEYLLHPTGVSATILDGEPSRVYL